MAITKRSDLLKDYQRVKNSLVNKSETVSRGRYRHDGAFSDRQIKKHFSNFRDFVQQAEAAFNCANPEIESAADEYLSAKQSSPQAGPQAETHTHTEDTWDIHIPKTTIHTLEELLEYCKVDTEKWKVERYIVNKWEMGYTVGTGDDKRVETQPLYQIKASLVRRKLIVSIREEIEELKAEAKAVARYPKPRITSIRQTGNLYELLIPDLHSGKFSYGKETGGPDYDLEIAIDTYRRAFDNLLDRAKGFLPERFVVGVGNDLLHTDTIQGTTYSGTKVDADSRYHKVYKTIRRMLCEKIEQLRMIAPVEVKLVPGNHDTLSNFTLGDSLECFFHNYSDVFVDNSPQQHRIVEWGKVLIALTHGDKGKHADYGIWLASTYPEEFGRTKFREVHIGHRHKTAVEEKFGIRVRTFSALCPSDAWHAQNHLVNNLRVAEGLMWNKEEGLVGQFYHTEQD